MHLHLHHRQRAKIGFTMIELLLVVVIIILASSIAGVQFSRSMHGAQLRTSVRTVVSMNKYARSQAVLSQKHMVLLYNSNLGILELYTLKKSSDGLSSDRFDQFGGGSGGRGGSGYHNNKDDEAEELEAGQVSVDQQNYKKRRLEDKITIEDFEVDVDDLFEEEGVYWVSYYPNGMCDGHKFTLVHENGRRAKVNVETITGDLKVKMGE